MQRRSLIKAFTLSASIVAMGLTWTCLLYTSDAADE